MDIIILLIAGIFFAIFSELFNIKKPIFYFFFGYLVKATMEYLSKL
jgi:hypothetical protein